MSQLIPSGPKGDRACRVAAPTRREWRRISARWQPLLEARIRELEQVRDNLANCVGCGCLSMRQCSLYNPQDVLGTDDAHGATRGFPRDDD